MASHEIKSVSPSSEKCDNSCCSIGEKNVKHIVKGVPVERFLYSHPLTPAAGENFFAFLDQAKQLIEQNLII